MAEKDTLAMETIAALPPPHRPVAIFRGAFAIKGDAEAHCERLFATHGWSGAWRNGIFPYHHFHARTHEVLGIARGSARVRFGGEKGPVVAVAAGDVIVIPAGTSHKNEGASPDLCVIGAYPGGGAPDMQKGTPAAAQDFTAVALPDADPVNGTAGPLLEAWRR